MWTDSKSRRLDFLRTREALGELTNAETTELESLFAELDMEEQQALANACERSASREGELRNQVVQLEHEVDHLERLRREHQELLTETRSFLRQLRSRPA